MIGKKAMGVGQVFIFIIAGVTFALIMIFGYNAISDFLAKGETVEFVQFKTDLESSVQKIFSEYGALRIEDFKMPAKYEKICFVDMDYPEKDIDALCKENVVACDVWEDVENNAGGYDSVNENVFLTPIAPVPIKVHNIKMDDGFLCMDLDNGRFKLVLEGKGDHTFLALPDN